MSVLHLPGDAADRLRAYLDAPIERMAFLLAAPTDGGWAVTGERYLTDASDYDRQGPFGMELADHVRPQLISWAHDHDAAVVEVHGHLFGPPTSFSRTDLAGFADVVPHLLWRLPGRPYTALVLGPDDLDAITWRTPDQPEALHAVELGDTTYRPTGLGLRLLAAAVHDKLGSTQ